MENIIEVNPAPRKATRGRWVDEWSKTQRVMSQNMATHSQQNFFSKDK